MVVFEDIDLLQSNDTLLPSLKGQSITKAHFTDLLPIEMQPPSQQRPTWNVLNDNLKYQPPNFVEIGRRALRLSVANQQAFVRYLQTHETQHITNTMLQAFNQKMQELAMRLRRRARATFRFGQGMALTGAKILLVAGLLLGAGHAVHAADIIVTGTSPSDPSTNGLCELAEAIDNANNNAVTHVDCIAGDDSYAGGDRIILNANIANVTFVRPAITSAITINAGLGNTINGASEQIFVVSNTGNLTLNNLSVVNGRTTYYGGAIYNNSGTITINNSTFSNNRVSGTGTYSPTPAGGAIYNKAGTLSINNSTFTGNFAISYGSTRGGAIFNSAGGQLTINNSTFSNNSAGAASGVSPYFGTGQGGAIFSLGTMTINNSTITNNSVIEPSPVSTVTRGGGISVFSASANTTIRNSIISGNSATYSNPECEIFGTFTSSNNIFGASSSAGGCPTSGSDIVPEGAIGTILNTTLTNNGDPTSTHALVANSPAIDASGTGALTSDQRGAAAFDGDDNSSVIRDIGAFEYLGVPPTIAISVDNTTINEATGVTTATVTATISNFTAGSDIDLNFYFSGTALQVTDFAVGGGGVPLTFTAGGATSQTFTITAVSDSTPEGSESFVINAVVNGTATIASGNTLNMTIEDPLPPTFSKVFAPDLIEAGGTSTLTFTIDNSANAGAVSSLAFTDNLPAALTIATPANAVNNCGGTLTSTAGTGVVSLSAGSVAASSTCTISVDVSGNTIGTHVNTTGDLTSSFGNSGTASDTLTVYNTGTLTIEDVSQSEGDTETSDFTFTVTLDNDVEGFTVNYGTSNGTATAGEDYTSASGTLTFDGTAGETEIFTVSVIGDAIVESDETFTVTLSNASNVNVTASDTATGTITNDDGAVVLVDDVIQNEGNSGTTTMTFTATLQEAVDSSFTVDYTTSGVTAIAGEDYTSASGTLSFAGTAGETQTFAVSINGDTKVESDETFTVTLSNASNSNVTASDTAIGTITNDDGAVVLVEDVSLSEGDSGTSTMTFTATLQEAVDGSFTVNYTTSNNTAIAGEDYISASGTLSFAGTAGETKTFTVSITGDTTVEDDETFTVTLSAPSNADVTANDTATGTITNDDFTIEVLIDGGFEGTDKYQGAPLAWSPKNTTIPGKDKQKCDKPELSKYVANSGSCAFIFVGNPTDEKSKINQKIADISVFTDGSIVIFSVYVDNRSAKVNHPIGKLIVKYKNGDKDRKLLRISDPGIEGYTQIFTESITIDLTGRELDFVKVQFRYKLTTGKFFLDDASLTVTPATTLRTSREVMPLPDAPDGFRD